LHHQTSKNSWLYSKLFYSRLQNSQIYVTLDSIFLLALVVLLVFFEKKSVADPKIPATLPPWHYFRTGRRKTRANRWLTAAGDAAFSGSGSRSPVRSGLISVTARAHVWTFGRRSVKISPPAGRRLMHLHVAWKQKQIAPPPQCTTEHNTHPIGCWTHRRRCKLHEHGGRLATGGTGTRYIRPAAALHRRTVPKNRASANKNTTV
jgi:hypothetical protein